MVSIRKGADLDPGNPRILAALALLWAELGADSEADKWLDGAQAIDPDTFWSIFSAFMVRQYRGDVAGAADYAQALLADNPGNRWPLSFLTQIDLLADRPDIALERYRAAYPALLDDADPDINRTNYRASTDVALLLQTIGDQTRANALLERGMEVVQKIPRLGFGGHWISDARILAVQGNTDQALAALQQAIDEGWRMLWRSILKYDPTLISLHGNSKFQAIIAELEADMAAQLKHVREMEANGELEPFPQ
jgi:tetratricopeptide (TPR) repeat protein